MRIPVGHGFVVSALLLASLAAACAGTGTVGMAYSPDLEAGTGTDAGSTIDSSVVTDAARDAVNASGHIDQALFPTTCSKGLADLTPSGAFDAIEIRATLVPGGLPVVMPYTVLDKRGTACRTALDPATCQAAFDAAVVTTSAWSTNANFRGGPPPPPARYGFYVVSRADEVVTISTTEALVSFLAPIDTVSEAIQVHDGPLGGVADCPHVRSDTDGYSFFATGCGPFTGSAYTTTEVVTKVARDGTQSTIQTAGPFPDPTNRCAPVP